MLINMIDDQSIQMYATLCQIFIFFQCYEKPFKIKEKRSKYGQKMAKKGKKKIMLKVLFICHGNICRSTMAQYIAQHLVTQSGMESNFYIDSAATSREEIGNPVHYGTRRKLEAEGIFCGDHRARQLKKSDYDEFDFLIGMDTQNIRNMYRILGEDPEQKVYKLLDFTERKGDIADPWYTGNFDLTYRDVLDGCRGLLKFIEEQESV